jgi:hypothetical protein
MEPTDHLADGPLESEGPSRDGTPADNELGLHPVNELAQDGGAPLDFLLRWLAIPFGGTVEAYIGETHTIEDACTLQPPF